MTQPPDADIWATGSTPVAPRTRRETSAESDGGTCFPPGGELFPARGRIPWATSERLRGRVPAGPNLPRSQGVAGACELRRVRCAPRRAATSLTTAQPAVQLTLSRQISRREEVSSPMTKRVIVSSRRSRGGASGEAEVPGHQLLILPGEGVALVGAAARTEDQDDVEALAGPCELLGVADELLDEVDQPVVLPADDRDLVDFQHLPIEVVDLVRRTGSSIFSIPHWPQNGSRVW